MYPFKNLINILVIISKFQLNICNDLYTIFPNYFYIFVSYPSRFIMVKLLLIHELLLCHENSIIYFPYWIANFITNDG